MALDFGIKRTGVAVTDPLRIIASPLETIPTAKIVEFLKEYCVKEEVEVIVVGMPKRLNNEETHATAPAKEFINQLRKYFPAIKIEVEDERYTSKMAVDAMIKGGMKKKDRRKKGNIDRVSAALILQSYLESHDSF